MVSLDMKITKFNEFLNESFESRTKAIGKEWLNNATEKELQKIIVCYNDGQGDLGSATFEEMKNAVESEDLSVAEIFDKFYEDLGLTGNNSDAFYFDIENGYYTIDWID